MSNRLSFKAKGFAGIALVSLLILGLSIPAAAQTLKIGIIGPLSGPGAVWGQQIVRGAEMASEEISAKGVSRSGMKNTALNSFLTMTNTKAQTD